MFGNLEGAYLGVVGIIYCARFRCDKYPRDKLKRDCIMAPSHTNDLLTLVKNGLNYSGILAQIFYYYVLDCVEVIILLW